MRFRCKSNPNFALTKAGMSIRFKSGEYETDDPAEIRALSSHPAAEVASKADLVEEAKDLGIDAPTTKDKAELEEEVVEEIVDDADREQKEEGGAFARGGILPSE